MGKFPPKPSIMNAIIQTSTGNLQDSIAFYEKLGFTSIVHEQSTIVSDGKAVVEINPDRFARAGVKLYAASWEEIVSQLKKKTAMLVVDDGYLLKSPSGMWLSLIEGKTTPQINLEEIGSSVLGNYAGLSLEVVDMEEAVDFWAILGFKKTMGDVAQGWVAMVNADGFGVSVMKANMCPHLFFNPSLTYFNGKDNIAVITKIRELNIPITEEITHFNKEGIVDNIIIRDPGGLGFFLFSD